MVKLNVEDIKKDMIIRVLGESTYHYYDDYIKILEVYGPNKFKMQILASKDVDEIGQHHTLEINNMPDEIGLYSLTEEEQGLLGLLCD